MEFVCHVHIEAGNCVDKLVVMSVNVNWSLTVFLFYALFVDNFFLINFILFYFMHYSLTFCGMHILLPFIG